jgi:hypothetical protein
MGQLPDLVVVEAPEVSSATQAVSWCFRQPGSLGSSCFGSGGGRWSTGLPAILSRPSAHAPGGGGRQGSVDLPAVEEWSRSQPGTRQLTVPTSVLTAGGSPRSTGGFNAMFDTATPKVIASST